MPVGFIVEGFNDEIKLKQLFPQTHIVVTQGTRLNNSIRMKIKTALTVCNRVYLLTDPDEAGDLLANMLIKEFPTLTRIHVDPNQCICYRNRRKKIGIEHCDPSYLYRALKPYIKHIKLTNTQNYTAFIGVVINKNN